MDKEVLVKNLGMTEKEASVYLAILGLGNSTIKPIADRSGVKRTSIYYFIDRLVESGLVEQTIIRNRTYYKALPPQSMIDLQKSRLKEIEQALPDFMSIYNFSTKKPHMSYYEGPEQMKNIMLEENRCKEVLSIWPGKDVIDMVGGTGFMEELDRTRRANGTYLRVIRFKDRESTFRGSASGKDHMREIRWAPEGTDFPLAISVFDTGKVGFMTTRKEGFGIMIESKELERAMRHLFELFWAQATPAQPNEG